MFFYETAQHTYGPPLPWAFYRWDLRTQAFPSYFRDKARPLEPVAPKFKSQGSANAFVSPPGK